MVRFANENLVQDAGVSRTETDESIRRGCLARDRAKVAATAISFDCDPSRVLIVVIRQPTKKCLWAANRLAFTHTSSDKLQSVRDSLLRRFLLILRSSSGNFMARFGAQFTEGKTVGYPASE
jgi:hypothetical protein